MGSVIGLVLVACAALAVFYFRMHSPGNLTKRAQIALSQGDTDKAIAYLQEALANGPDTHVQRAARLTLARAYLRVGREEDARTHVGAALAAAPDDREVLDVLLETHVATALRKHHMALKPLTAESAATVLEAVDREIDAISQLMERYPQSPSPLIARAQLRHLRYFIQSHRVFDARRVIDGGGDALAVQKAQEELKRYSTPATAYRDGALEDLKLALDIDKRNVTAVNMLAQYQLDDRRYDAVHALVQRMLEEEWYVEGAILSGTNAVLQDAKARPGVEERLSAARAMLTSFLEKKPDSPQVAVALGQLELQNGQVEKARDLAKKAMELSPHLLDARLLMAACALRERRPAETIQQVTPLTTSHGNVPQVWYLLGQANSDAGHFQAADDAFRKALALRQDFPEARRGIFANHLRAGNMEAADRLAPELVREDRFYMPAWGVYIDALRRGGQGQRVRAELAALAEDKNLPEDARDDLVRLLARAQMFEEADAALSALEKDGESPRTRRLRAALTLYRGDGPAAREMLAKAVEAYPEDADTRVDYAEALMKAQLLPDARAQLESAAKRANEVEQHIRIAQAYLQLRMPSQVEAQARAALALQPRNTRALALLAQAQGMAGDTGIGDVTAGLQGTGQLTVADMLRLGRMAADRGDHQKALQLARMGLAKDPNSAQLRLLGARAVFGLNQKEAAANEITLAARAAPQDAGAYEALASLFATAADASSGMAHADRLIAYNPVYANWAKGRLHLAAGKPDAALRDFQAGLEQISKAANVRAAKEALYNGLLNAQIARGDEAGYRATIDRIAADEEFAAMARLAAADRFTALQQKDLAVDQLEQLARQVDMKEQPPSMVLAYATRWANLGDRDRALAAVDVLPPEARNDVPALSFLAALHQQSGQLDEALALRRKLVAADEANPTHLTNLALLQARLRDFPAALATLRQAEERGQTGAAMARSARVRIYAALGLVQAATEEIQAVGGSVQEGDHASALAIGQAWAQLNKPAEARAMLESIPAYAVEYPAAQVALARLEEAGGSGEAALARLRQVYEKHPGTGFLPLYQTLLRQDRAGDALALAEALQSRAAPGTTSWDQATILVATAARDAGAAEKALATLGQLAATGRHPLAHADAAMVHLAQGQRAEAAERLADLPDAGPAFLKSTLGLLARGDQASADAFMKAHADELDTAQSSVILALLAAQEPGAWKALLSDQLKTTRLFRGDMEALIDQLVTHPKGREVMWQMALAQRMLESGWAAPALRQLADVRKQAPQVAFPLVQQYEAQGMLRKKEQQAAIREEMVKQQGALPTARLLKAQQLLSEKKYAEALPVLEPLAKAEPHRLELVTAIGQLHEKLGQLDQAIALTRQVRAADPEDVASANNLAYLLVQARPNDPAARREARELIAWAMKRSPNNPALADTQGWIHVLEGQTPEAIDQLSKAIAALRLQPAVHYHMGMAYAKAGQHDLARLHLTHVKILAGEGESVPEVPLAAEALKALPAAETASEARAP